MLITVYILVFVPEKKKISKEKDVEAELSTDGSESDEEELVIYPSQTLSILKDILTNENLKTYIVFLIVSCACYTIDSNVSQVYMTNEVSVSF